MKRLALLVPALNEAHNVDSVIRGYVDVRETMKLLGVETALLVIDDGSRDGTFVRFRQCLIEAKIPARLLRFGRNFGKDSAILAGLEKNEADYYVIVDADGQTPWALVPRLYESIADGGADVVCGVKEREPYGLPRRALTGLFFFLARKLGIRELRSGASDFMLFTRAVRDRLLALQEKEVVVRNLVHWLGLREKCVPFTPGPSGRSRFSFRSLFLLAVKSILSFSHILRINFFIALFYWIFSFFYAGLIIYNKITHRIVLGLSTTTLLTLLSFGLMFFMIAIIGEYLITIFEEVKKRPRYLIAEIVDLE
ncbi:MAG: glycosyltransferase [Candidatus Aminicenantes bacterium]|nr:glycosyltransferase [Candidatus Aminicenantes bacterium]